MSCVSSAYLLQTLILSTHRYKFPFSLPPFYIAIIRCLGVLEGLAIQVDPKARIISKAYPYIASRVLTDPQDDLQEALRRLALTNDGRVRWDRLEDLLDEAKDSSEYDVAEAIDMLTDYLVSEDGDDLLNDLAQQLVDTADSLGAESAQYIVAASQALAIRDEVAAVRAFRSLASVLEQREEGINAITRKATNDLRGALPEPTPTMRRLGNVLGLLGAQSGETDLARFIPIVRKLSKEPRIRQVATEVVARIGERFLSRSLRAAFGLPAPQFGKATSLSTVTEDTK